MTHQENPLPRRTVLKGAGLGLIAGSLDQALPAEAETPDMADNSSIWSASFAMPDRFGPKCWLKIPSVFV